MRSKIHQIVTKIWRNVTDPPRKNDSLKLQADFAYLNKTDKIYARRPRSR